MKKLCLCILTGLMLTGCRWLPQPREMGDMALVRCVGVDQAGEQVTLTLSTGLRAQGTQGGEKPALYLSAQGRSLSGAVSSAQLQSQQTLFLGYVDQLLLGEEQLDEGIDPVLHWLSGDRELSLGVWLWVIRGDTAQTAVQSGGDDGPDTRLEHLRMEGNPGAAPTGRTAMEVAIALEELGCAYVPALRMEENRLTPAGYAVLTTHGLAGYMENDAARGLELLAQKPMAQLLELDLPENHVTVCITGSKLDCTGIFGRNGLERLELICRVQAEISQQNGPLTQQEQEILTDLIEEKVMQYASSGAARLQAFRTDCVALSSRLALAQPWYEPCRTGQWNDIFAGTGISVSARATLGMERR